MPYAILLIRVQLALGGEETGGAHEATIAPKHMRVERLLSVCWMVDQHGMVNLSIFPSQKTDGQREENDTSDYLTRPHIINQNVVQ